MSLLLEISTRPYLYTLSKRFQRPIKKISEIPESVFDEWKGKGFDWVWMMGVWQVGNYGINYDRTNNERQKHYSKICPDWTVDDVIGSPYAIVSYTVNPEIGDANDIIELRKKLHERGMKLMLDFVPNHTAFDSPEIESAREYYIHAPDNCEIDAAKYGPGGIAFGSIFKCRPWPDVAQLNYMNEKCRKWRIDVLLEITSLCDGVRCDVADAELNEFFWNKWQFELEKCGYNKLEKEFWAEAISAVREKFPGTVFLAEANYDTPDTKLMTCGFDYIYDRVLFKKLEKPSINNINQILANLKDPNIAHYAHFIENHDEIRSLSTFKSNPNLENAAAVAVLTLPGLRIINQDQWCGYEYEIGVHLRRAVDEEPKEDMMKFYQKLFDFLKSDVIVKGCFQFVEVDKTNVLSYRWDFEDAHVVILVNLLPMSSEFVFDFGYNINLINQKNIEILSDKSVHLEQYSSSETKSLISIKGESFLIYKF